MNKKPARALFPRRLLPIRRPLLSLGAPAIAFGKSWHFPKSPRFVSLHHAMTIRTWLQSPRNGGELNLVKPGIHHPTPRQPRAAINDRLGASYDLAYVNEANRGSQRLIIENLDG
jgi:hypothetical protein